jgi:hypothetical protein
MTQPAAAPWPSEAIDTTQLRLDPENARIDVRPTASQEEVRAALLDQAGVADLADEIAESGANFAGERIIALKKPSGEYLVLEGNRRTCACQLLLDPRLIPAGHRKKFPSLPSSLRSQITTLTADLAPTREAAEPIISRRHMTSPVLPWTVIAQQRRIAKRLKDGKSIDEIAQELRMKPGQVRSLAREHQLLERAIQSSTWTRTEQRALADPGLKANPFVRFFELRGTKEALGMTFKDDGSFTSKLLDEDFNPVFGQVARAFLLPDPTTGKPYANTRTTPESLFKHLAATSPALKKLLPKPGSTMLGKTGKRTTVPRTVAGKVDEFFESVKCSIDEHQLRQITSEISRIDYKHFPAAGSFLLRAIMEGSLIHALKTTKHWNAFKKSWYAEPKNHGRDPGLEFIIKYCIKECTKIFADNETRVLQKWLQHKDSWDLVMHLKTLPKWTDLNAAAGVTRPLIVKIFDGTAFPT